MINFFVNQMTMLKIYIPLIVEIKKRGGSVNCYVTASHKYNCPLLKHNFTTLVKLSKLFDFNVEIMEETNKKPSGVMFTVERNLIEADPDVPYWRHTDYFDHSRS